MDFEYDPKKSAANKVKHGIDFEDAQALWTDERAVEVQAKDRNEPRRMAIGLIAGKHWTAIFTRRDDRIRLISVRRSREEEIGRYDKEDELDKRN